MTREEMFHLFFDAFEGRIGEAVQWVARHQPKDLDLAYEVAAAIRGKR